MDKDFVNKMESIVGPDWKGGNPQIGEVILDHFEPLFSGQTVNDPRFVDFLIDSLQIIKQEMLEKKV
jgi:hypothetical protein